MDRSKAFLRTLALVAAALWVLATTIFFFIRFSTVFYEANRDPMNPFVERVGRWLGFGS